MKNFDDLVGKTSRGAFPKRRLARVRIVKSEEHSSYPSYQFIDADAEDQLIWLTVETDTSDDYYPLFSFAYTPK